MVQMYKSGRTFRVGPFEKATTVRRIERCSGIRGSGWRGGSRPPRLKKFRV